MAQKVQSKNVNGGAVFTQKLLADNKKLIQIRLNTTFKKTRDREVTAR